MVKTGLDILVQQRMDRLKNKSIALLAHPASVDSKLVHILERCQQFGVSLVRLFGPEHGIRGEAQDMEAVEKDAQVASALPVISLYGSTEESLYLSPRDLEGVDLLVCDLQDVGSRYYTFSYTIAYAMRACAKANVSILILDRPNPIGGKTIEGNIVQDRFSSFVGAYPLANRHGMSLGELVHFFLDEDPNLQGFRDVEVVWMEGWRRDQHFEDTLLPWVMPSPNMPTPDTALVYPGACLFEGTNLSEGRGTTRPFELVGAPYIDDPDRMVNQLKSLELPGVQTRPAWFKPMFQKHANQLCGGLQIHVTDRERFRPLETGVAILWAARHFAGFDWRRETYEFVSDHLAIDLLFGDDKPRLMLEDNAELGDIMTHLQNGQNDFSKKRQRVLHHGYQ